jgi:hopanoid biosynthesis associated protein HpnK
LIINADDFGGSRSINRAVIQAHREGVLTSASLMVAGEAFDEAVEGARQNPTLGVGLHLTLVCGKAVLPFEKISGLVNRAGEFSPNPVRAGFTYFARRELEVQLRAEIAAQFEKFKATGLKLDHVNGHLNMHLHPTVLRALLEILPRFGGPPLRVTRDPFWLNARLGSGRWLYRASHAFIYLCLARRARVSLRRMQIRHAARVFGLLQNGCVDEAYVLKLLDRLPAGDSELYSHPSLDKFRHELDALVSARVRRRMDEEGINRIRYQDL